MKHSITVNALGNRLISHREIRRRLADEIHKQKEIIRGLEEAYKNTYKAERCELDREHFN